MPAKKVRSQARDAGVADRTMDRAKATLGIVSRKVGRPGEPGQGWEWLLPGHERSTPPKAEDRHTNTLANFDDLGVLRDDETEIF